MASSAAFRMAISDSSNNTNDDTLPVMEELDISSCSVGDVGVEAIALAISSNPGCLLRLDLSNNIGFPA